MKPIKVTLIAGTDHPIQAICRIWEASRHNDPIEPIEDFQTPEPEELDLFQKVLDNHIPVAEMVDFVFLIENMPISLREQMVRHRIGVKVGERIGADIVPDLADSSWWSQSMRILNMGEFYSAGEYHIPESIQQSPEAACEYRAALGQIEDAYNRLANAYGIPLEDARGLIPLCATHRIVWKLNLSALMHTIGKRACWILQLGLWRPVIEGIVRELAVNVHPVFWNLISPPCLKGNSFSGCHFHLDNQRRIEGEDEIPPCPLYLHHHEDEAQRTASQAKFENLQAAWEFVSIQGETHWHPPSAKAAHRFMAMGEDYSQMWNRTLPEGQLKV